MRGNRVPRQVKCIEMCEKLILSFRVFCLINLCSLCENDKTTNNNKKQTKKRIHNSLLCCRVAKDINLSCSFLFWTWTTNSSVGATATSHFRDPHQQLSKLTSNEIWDCEWVHLYLCLLVRVCVSVPACAWLSLLGWLFVTAVWHLIWNCSVLRPAWVKVCLQHFSFSFACSTPLSRSLSRFL